MLYPGRRSDGRDMLSNVQRMKGAVNDARTRDPDTYDDNAHSRRRNSNRRCQDARCIPTTSALITS